MFYACNKKQEIHNQLSNSEYLKDTAEINQLNSLSFKIRTLYPDSSKLLALKAIEHSSKIDYKKGLGEGYTRLGILEKNIGNNDSAIYYHSKSLYYRQLDKDSLAIGRSYNNIGNIFNKMNNYDSAIYYHLEAVKIAELFQDTADLADYTNNLGIDFNKNGDYTEAYKYNIKYLKLAQHLNDTLKTLKAHVNLSSTLIDSVGLNSNYDHLLDTALVHLNVVFKNKEWLAEDNILADAYSNAGLIYQSRINKDLDSALYCFEKAMNIYRAGNSAELCQALSNIGLLNVELKNYKIALGFFEESNLLAIEADKKDILKVNAENLAYIHNNLGNYKKASEYLNDYIRYNASIYNEEKTRVIAEMHTKYETEKKDTKNRFLAEQNEMQQIMLNKREVQIVVIVFLACSLFTITILLFNRRQLQRKLDYQQQLEKDRMRISKDLHDDIGGALTSISMYSGVINEQINNNQTAEAQNYLSEIADTSRELMGKMSDLVWAINPVNDSFENLIQRVRNYALRILQAQNMTLHFNTDPAVNHIELHMDIRHHLFMILKELITNAAKYSKAKNVFITLQKFQEEIIISLKDDGIGFDPKIEFEGNGLRNMAQRAEQSKLQLDIISEVNEGTSVKIRFPIV